MEDRTAAVLTALTGLRHDLDRVVPLLRHGAPPPLQRALAARLIEVGELLDDHADAQAVAGNGHADGMVPGDAEDRDC
ncbi:hypothetical protein [Saccharomonospora piscinae]|uniref:Uncharacterized protein n=1 Tax=Saccharomonospora piscinae TaxID=687388 RepID=A0A1V9A5P0_SACPI|nr:hypothetical protein [Saccharomonospora piscinae]OQO92244.1 hypothetical protein B1813_08410 [Saccharomonospora piscinae]TLW92051.1 hypothetical protein FFT09_14260 [Saccharomonospora piscinae]